MKSCYARSRCLKMTRQDMQRSWYLDLFHVLYSTDSLTSLKMIKSELDDYDDGTSHTEIQSLWKVKNIHSMFNINIFSQRIARSADVCSRFIQNNQSDYKSRRLRERASVHKIVKLRENGGAKGRLRKVTQRSLIDYTGSSETSCKTQRQI